MEITKYMEQKLSNVSVNKKRFIREMIFRALYAVEMGCQADESLLNMITKDNIKRTKKQIAIDDLEQSTVIDKINSIVSKKPEIDLIIEKHLVGWKMERISIVDLSILRASIYDLLYNNDVPVNVTISEAVLLADMFSDEKQKKFINGILGAILKDINKSIDGVEAL